MNTGWCDVIAVARQDGPSLSNSNTQTSIVEVNAKPVIAANTLYVGRKYLLSGFGRLSNIATAPGTLTLAVMLGGTAVFSSGAMNFSTTAHTTLPFWFDAEITCRSVGGTAAATFMGLFRVCGQPFSLTSAADNASTMPLLLAPNSAPAVGAGFDSTVDNILDLTAQFSVANAGNLIQLHDYSVLRKN